MGRDKIARAALEHPVWVFVGMTCSRSPRGLLQAAAVYSSDLKKPDYFEEKETDDIVHKTTGVGGK